MRRDSVIIVLAFLVASLGVWNNGFVRDDLLFFRAVDCDLSPSSVITLFKQCYFHEAGEIFYYRPLARLFYRVENFFFQADPRGYHAVAVALYALFLCTLNVVLKPWVPGRVERLIGLLWLGLHPLTHSYWVYMTGLVDTLPLLMTCLAILSARTGHALGLAGSLAACTLAVFSKEVGIFSYAIVAWELWRIGRGRMLARFLVGGWVTAGGYLILRSFVASTPAVDSFWGMVPLVLALGRESFWTLLQTLLRPDLCQQEYHVLSEFPGDFVFLCGSLAVWFGLACTALRWRLKAFVPLALLFLAFWSLNIFNMYFSIELSDEGRVVHLLYIPDHLQFVPLACVLFPLVITLCQSRHGMTLVLAAAVLTSVVSALKVGEWHDETSLFEAIVRREPPLSRPYRVLALRQLEARNLEGAILTINRALKKGLKNSELYHLASQTAGLSGDEAMEAAMEADAIRRGILESMIELPIILRNPDGREKAQVYLQGKQQLFPREPWFQKQAEVLK
ncbi:MAG: hypothetical protein AB7F75_02765 [Planctomycetota bacterium]